jgi:hypothetical protein
LAAPPIHLEAVAEKSETLFALFSLWPLMQRPENSNLFCCFLAWRLADDNIQGAVTVNQMAMFFCYNGLL